MLLKKRYYFLYINMFIKYLRHMKKYFLLLVFFSVFLSGCSQSVSDDIDFSQNTKNFQNSIQKLQQNISTFS